eukprot:gnl/MRDRNA2_/MRDRNA2_212128_c0_seq1.p1 gnl/MRDRNA2_/MRDRNA2_212128_c0~~gnl/MRDRNA2_/MRDRNA2_212128_c0_seq1.p1  ORF type:complete len:691 (-),score=91.16 gnl/MRDRNA2_/MRDRNA2_212128_c0_seq1:37-2109(-)
MKLFSNRVLFPKFVEIHSRRLASLHRLLVIGLLAVPIKNFAFRSESQYYTGFQVHYWPTNWKVSDEQMNLLNEADSQKDYCISPSKFEYCDTKDCMSWAAKEMACMDLCTDTSDNFQDCLERGERFFKDSDGSIFVPTFFNDLSTILTPEAGQRKGKVERRVEEKARIIKGIEDMGIGFDHGYSVKLNDPFTPESVSNKDTVSDTVESGYNLQFNTRYNDGLLTIVKDANGIEIMKFLPGEVVYLPMEMILSIANITLDDVNEKYGENLSPNAQSTHGILTRLAGAEIVLDISYHNPLYLGGMFYQYNWKGPVAFITISSQLAWTSRPTFQILDTLGSTRMRYYQGVRISFIQTGTFAWIDLSRIATCLTSMIVFYKSAATVLFFFSIRYLGGLSTLYRGFCYQPASIGRECCSLAVKLACRTSTFLELQDLHTGISRRRLLHRFTQVFKSTEQLTPMQIRRFVHFVFDGLTAMKEDEGLTTMKEDEDPDENEWVDIEKWSQASAYSEPLGFDSVVQIFDADRKKGFLERFFAPKALKTILKTDSLVRQISAKNNVTSKSYVGSEKVDTMIAVIANQDVDRRVSNLASEITSDTLNKDLDLDKEPCFFERMVKVEHHVKNELEQEIATIRARLDQLEKCDQPGERGKVLHQPGERGKVSQLWRPLGLGLTSCNNIAMENAKQIPTADSQI